MTPHSWCKLKHLSRNLTMERFRCCTWHAQNTTHRRHRFNRALWQSHQERHPNQFFAKFAKCYLFHVMICCLLYMITCHMRLIVIALYNLCRLHNRVWLGLKLPHNSDHPDDFLWEDNDPISWTNWADFEPNHMDTSKCVSMGINGRWYTRRCLYTELTVCQPPTFINTPTPGTVIWSKCFLGSHNNNNLLNKYAWPIMSNTRSRMPLGQ